MCINGVHNSSVSGGGTEHEAPRLDLLTSQPFLGAFQCLQIAERQPKLMRFPWAAVPTRVPVQPEQSNGPNHPAQIADSIILVVRRRGGKRSGAHQLVAGREVWSARGTALRPGDKFPAALGQKAVIGT